MIETLTKTTSCDFEPPEYEFHTKVKVVQGKAQSTQICAKWISLDTETAWNHDDETPIAWIYQWCFKFGEVIVTGRKPSEFVACLRKIQNKYDLSSSRQVVIFVHNLSYDIEYLRQWLVAEFGKCKMLCIKPHKFITFEVGGFIFKCTYKLSNKPLRTWASDLGTKHRKIAEKKSYYQEIHYQDEELTDENWRYQIEDVLVLDEAIEKQMETYGDTLLTIPLTSTGYVRRDCRRNYKKDRRNRKRFLKTALTAEQYEACAGEFEGGVTHGNRFFANKTVRPDPSKGEFIRHRDFRSHYPSQQRTKKFPVGTWCKYGTHLSISDVKPLLKTYCVLMRITFENVTIRHGVVLPILSATRAYKGRKTRLDMVEDNGRVLSLSGVFTIHCTELDLYWILQQYEIESYDIECAWICAKGYIPEYLRVTVDDYFLGKTKWKTEERREKDKGEAADKERLLWLGLELMKSKNGLNGLYGMTATSILRTSYEVEPNGEWKAETPELSKALAQYYASENNFNRYQFGIYTTSHARYELLWFADFIQKNGGTVLYVDTDSIFYVSNAELEEKLEGENARRRERALEMGAYVEFEGKKVNYDAFEDEREDIIAFRFLHAKCYAYEQKTQSGKIEMKCVIAGVEAFEDATHEFSREDELGSIDNLTQGTTFVRCGGTKAKYVEMPPAVVNVDGHLTEVGSACIITNTTKTLKSELETYDEVIEWEVV